MTGSGVQEIVTGVWCWQRRPRGLRPSEFGARTSYAVGGLACMGQADLDPLTADHDRAADRYPRRDQLRFS